MRRRSGMACLTAALMLLLLAAMAPSLAGQERCLGPVAGGGPIRPVALQGDEIGLTYVGHSTFVIETPGGVTIATDYNDYVRPAATPTAATMNRAHDTHFSLRPDPAIQHVLRGWAEPGRPAEHDLVVGDARIRNVPTNIREGFGATMYYGNSIFVFEIAGLCIAHLGHLHHTLTPIHLAALGPIDVVLVPVDGSFTLNIDGMIEVLQQIRAPLMIPMHYFGSSTLNRFLDRARAQGWEIERAERPGVIVTKAALPATPKLLVLPPGG